MSNRTNLPIETPVPTKTIIILHKRTIKRHHWVWERRRCNRERRRTRRERRRIRWRLRKGLVEIAAAGIIRIVVETLLVMWLGSIARRRHRHHRTHLIRRITGHWVSWVGSIIGRMLGHGGRRWWWHGARRLIAAGIIRVVVVMILFMFMVSTNIMNMDVFFLLVAAQTYAKMIVDFRLFFTAVHLDVTFALRAIFAMTRMNVDLGLLLFVRLNLQESYSKNKQKK